MHAIAVPVLTLHFHHVAVGTWAAGSATALFDGIPKANCPDRTLPARRPEIPASAILPYSTALKLMRINV
jgi:hypothetical protein